MPVLQFKGKTAIENYHHAIPHHILEFDRELSVLDTSEKPGLDGNLIIEGDNLLALKALLPTHAGRIKCIYIDPPYNTGNEGWVFNDNLTQPQFKEWIGQTVGKEGEDATRHDKWCCMMYPRLQLLKELLCDDGAIFVSIDDNEVAHLRMLMDEIFGEPNFVATIIWQNIYTIKNSAKYLSDMHDYIVLYAKNKSVWRPILSARTQGQREEYTNPDNDRRGPWISHALQSRNYYSKGTYQIKCPGGRLVEGPPAGTYWRMEESKFWDKDKEKRVWWGRDRNSSPRIKEYLSEAKEGIVPTTLWLHRDAGTNSDAKTALREIFSDAQEVFVTPKPVTLVRRVLSLCAGKEDLVLDSFAGSGTTAHAVLEQNREDNGNRHFVLVQIPYETKENEKEAVNICEKVTAERVRRLIQGYKYKGVREEILLEEQITLRALREGPDLIARVDELKSANADRFDSITATCKEGTLMVAGRKEVPDKVEGLGGSFGYARVGAPLFGEYRDFGDKPPTYEELAKYIFYTETSKEFDHSAVDEKTGKIGEYRSTSYYLLYSPNGKEGRALDMEWLTSTGKSDRNKNLVIYCEKLWVHRDDLARYETESGHKIRPMLVPFNLK